MPAVPGGKKGTTTVIATALRRAAMRRPRALRVDRGHEATLEEARRSQWRLQERAEDDIVKLAVAVAEKLTVTRLGPMTPSSSRSLRACSLKSRGAHRAHETSPGDPYPSVRRMPVVGCLYGRPCTLQFLPDDGLQAGDVVIETDWGLIDGRVQSRWQRIIEGLDLLEHEADDTD